MGLEPATYTSEALLAQYLHGSYRYLKQLIMQIVHITQLDSAGTDSLPKGGFLQGNPNLRPYNLAQLLAKHNFGLCFRKEPM
jgi:hypothetical protein